MENKNNNIFGTAEVITTVDLFGFVKALLTDKDMYAKFTSQVKAQHFFMTQRMLSKQYPRQMQKANVQGIDPVAILDSYHFRLCNHGHRPPQWLYAKGGKEEVATKEQMLYNKITEDKAVYEYLLKQWQIEPKSVEQLIELRYDQVTKDYEEAIIAIVGQMKRKRGKA
ncbi:hypothetical protein MA9V2_037 [Chryseobacterium phage MA9V-2]|nr:hypothetical protein MA9V2_037 [Chryseobacterium phage MA9V-2]